MQIFLCVCFIAAFVCSADGQGDASTICKNEEDFVPCPVLWDCDLEVSQCYCKSETPYCRCNNYIDEFYIGKNCAQKWTTLSFALVATLPGVALAFVIGVAVHLAHRFGKRSKSQGAGNDVAYIPEQDLFPGVVFASDLNSPPPGPTPAQVGLPMALSRPYSVSGNTHILPGGPPMGVPRPQYSASDNTRPAFERPPEGPLYSVSGNTQILPGGAPMGVPRPQYSLTPTSPAVSVSDRPAAQPYSYTGGGAQVLSNPHSRARNPYEEHNAPAEPYNQTPSAYEEQRMAPPPTPEYRSVFPRAQVGRLY